MNDAGKTYSDGLKDAWDTAKRISNMTNEEKFHMFGVAPRDNVFECLSAERAMRVMDIKAAMAGGILSREILENFMRQRGMNTENLGEKVSIIQVVEIIDELLSRIIEL